MNDAMRSIVGNATGATSSSSPARRGPAQFLNIVAVCVVTFLCVSIGVMLAIIIMLGFDLCMAIGNAWRHVTAKFVPNPAGGRAGNPPGGLKP